ncbi:DUF2321 domain-containing protein [Snodgrassella alvi]|uniref:DUF2321 domain-containing protein n=1 Tax=Snodgrassella alvi TaxID=1196083 RepID=UPI000C1F266A
MEGVLYLSSQYKPPAFCYNCGKAFPWTERKIASAVEFVNIQAALSPEELYIAIDSFERICQEDDLGLNSSS